MAKREFSKKRPNRIVALVMYLFTISSIAAPVIQWAFKVGWVFIDHETKIEGLAQIVFFVMIANAIFAIYALVRYCSGWRSKIGNIVVTVLFVLSSLLGILFQIMNYICSVIARPAPLTYSLPQTVPWVVALIGVPFLLLVWSRLDMKKTSRKVISGVLALSFVATMVLSLADPGKPKLLAGPVVLDTGTGEYSIVFATDKETQGFVRYSYSGKEKERYSTDTVLRRIGKIHAIRVPREELENNSYSLWVREVKYGLIAHVGKANYGKMLQLGDAVNFKGSREIENPKIMALSDWHEQMPTMKRAVDAFNVEPDLVLLLGDYVNYYADEADVVSCIIGGASEATFGGKIPAIFVRGNHEVRGNYMGLQDIDRLLGLDKLYYEAERGNYIFTVLDSAESEWDSDAWEHEDQYTGADYLARQLDWFESLKPADGDKYRIVLIHDRWFAHESGGTSEAAGYINMSETDKLLNKSMQKRYQDELLKLGVHLTISGHSHSYHASTPEWANSTLTQIEDGGRGSVSGTGKSIGKLTIIPATPEFTATLLTFQGESMQMQGKRASGPSGKHGNIHDMESFVITKVPKPSEIV
ncbi:MAG: metallophosphoesterase [Oscillospiraceae bacterium]|nr:metallophosphoesterase [Oscillospiraceae bacterium]